MNTEKGKEKYNKIRIEGVANHKRLLTTENKLKVAGGEVAVGGGLNG